MVGGGEGVGEKHLAHSLFHSLTGKHEEEKTHRCLYARQVAVKVEDEASLVVPSLDVEKAVVRLHCKRTTYSVLTHTK